MRRLHSCTNKRTNPYRDRSFRFTTASTLTLRSADGCERHMYLSRDRGDVMRIISIVRIAIIVAGLATGAYAQQELTHTTTPANTNSIMSSIDLPGLTGNPLAIIVATPLGNTKLLNT